jgi:hypothetical protein
MPDRDAAELLRRRADTLRAMRRSILDPQALTAVNESIDKLEAKARRLDRPASVRRRPPSSRGSGESR